MSDQSKPPLIVDSTTKYFEPPYSLLNFEPGFLTGLWVLAFVGLTSFLSTLSLLAFLGSRFITWRKHYQTYIGYNQYVVLIINLLLADFMQALSFVLSFHWIQVKAILAPTSHCFAQGWFLNVGDVGSGFFVFFIAAHGIKYYVRAGNWCWVSIAYERERLALHYIWLFMVQFSTVIIYLLVLLHLRKTMAVIRPAAQQSDSYSKVDRAAKLMVVYPFAYIVLTLPLSAGRMWSMAHHGAGLPDSYAFVAGCLIGSSGWADVILYTMTRKHLIQGSKGNKGTSAQSVDRNGALRDFENSRSGNFSKANAIVSTSREDYSDGTPWILPADGRIAQTRTVTVTGGRASMAEDHPAFELHDRTEHRRRLSVPRLGMSRHARSGSAEPIIHNYSYGPAYGPGQIRSEKLGTATEVSAEGSEQESLKSDGKSLQD